MKNKGTYCCIYVNSCESLTLSDKLRIEFNNNTHSPTRKGQLTVALPETLRKPLNGLETHCLLSVNKYSSHSALEHAGHRTSAGGLQWQAAAAGYAESVSL